MNENGEPEMSSVITARLELINGYVLHIQVLCKSIILLL